jgi:hypothetical protein
MRVVYEHDQWRFIADRIKNVSDTIVKLFAT